MSEVLGASVSTILKAIASWLLARAIGWRYPEAKCRAKISIFASGGGPLFELRSSRSTPALIGLQIAVINSLPFEIDVEIRELEIRYNSQRLAATLNKHVRVAAPGVASVDLGEFNLSEAQRSELCQFGKGGAHLRTTICGTVKSGVRNFELRTDLEMKAMVNCDWKLLV